MDSNESSEGSFGPLLSEENDEDLLLLKVDFSCPLLFVESCGGLHASSMGFYDPQLLEAIGGDWQADFFGQMSSEGTGVDLKGRSEGASCRLLFEATAVDWTLACLVEGSCGRQWFEVIGGGCSA